MHAPSMNGEEVDQQEFTRMVDTFLGGRINYFDTARWLLKRKKRDSHPGNAL